LRRLFLRNCCSSMQSSEYVMVLVDVFTPDSISPLSFFHLPL
jgi:hypothetical protein